MMLHQAGMLHDGPDHETLSRFLGSLMFKGAQASKPVKTEKKK